MNVCTNLCGYTFHLKLKILVSLWCKRKKTKLKRIHRLDTMNVCIREYDADAFHIFHWISVSSDLLEAFDEKSEDY